MTVAAEGRALDMIDRFRRRLHCADRRVAAHACRARALELAANMAAIATDIGMRVVEVKPGAEMIERFLGVGRRKAQYQHQYRYAEYRG